MVSVSATVKCKAFRGQVAAYAVQSWGAQVAAQADLGAWHHP